MQGQLTNDIVALEERAGCYAAYLTPQGRMIADMEVANASGRILLDVHESVRETLVERFNALVFTEEVEVSDGTERWDGVGVSGPTAGVVTASAIAALTNGEAAAALPDLPEHSCVRVTLGDGELVAIRTDPLGSWGLDLWVEKGETARLLDALVDAGCGEAGALDCETVRIENGRPAFPIDMDGETIPLEAGIESRALSFTKGCYVGQEVIVRILHRGQGRIARKLLGLACIAPIPAAIDAGASLFHADNVVGHVTSSCVSPALSTVIALGYVARDYVEAGTELRVGSERHAAVVTPLPFVEL